MSFMTILGDVSVTFSHQTQLQGKQAELYTASFDPSSGTLGPNASLEITVTFISHSDVSTKLLTQDLSLNTWECESEGGILCCLQLKMYQFYLDFVFFWELSLNICLFVQLELTEVAALCEVQGMNSPLVVGIVASKIKKLSVSYSLPSVW